MKFYARISNNILQQGYGLDEASYDATIQQYPNDVFLEVHSFCAPDTHYYQNGVVIEKPPKPSSYCFWDDVTFSWVDNAQLKAFEVKQTRNTMLFGSDWTQLPNNPLTTEQQAAWATYRQELRDITNQSGYPFNVIWPVAPI